MVPRHHNNFDLIRLVAALQVVVIHTIHHLDLPVHKTIVFVISLFPGVPIFFFVSGFLIFRSAKRTSTLTKFFRNRFLRIYPGLWGCLVFSILIALIVGNLSYSFRDMVVWIFAQATIVQFYNPDFLRNFGVGVLNGSLWTIPVELQFYIVVPFLYYACKRVGWRFWPALIVLTLLTHVGFQMIYSDRTMVSKLLQVTVIPWLIFFAYGMIATEYWDKIDRYFRGKVAYWALGFFATTALLLALKVPCTGNQINVLSAFALCGLTLSLAHTWTGISFSLLKGNDISYGVYLFHMPLVNAAIEYGYKNSWAAMIVVILATCGIATLSWRLIEKPCLRRKQASSPNKSSAETTPDMISEK